MGRRPLVKVKILFFAQSKDLAGVRESTIDLPEQIGYDELLEQISNKYNLKAIKNNILLAKNEEVCDEQVLIDIKERDQIAVIPPISGG